MDQRRRNCLIWLGIGVILPATVIRRAVGQNQTPRVIRVQIKKRKVIAPTGSIRITEKEVVELRWSSDEPVKLHLHGYDKEVRVNPGAPTAMSITAHATGRFPITSHGWGAGAHGHHALIYLEVYPR
ncbi:MAG: hypothetical protein ACI9MU_002429 [Alphaproteobacteria bacterium]|jgi:hypothetical protein